MKDFSWFFLIPGIDHHNVHVLSAGLVTLLLCATAFFAWKKLRKTGSRIVPDEKITLAGLYEIATENILSLMEGVMGPKAPRYLPLIGSLFIYIFVSNLFSVIPGFLPPTDNINTNLPLALIVFIYYNTQGIRENGPAYFKHFLGPVFWLGPLMLVIEVISHVVRPLSLSLRLFGNITGDHLVLGIFSGFGPLISIPFLGLALFVSFIQAFVFCLLSMIYVALATGHEEAHAHSLS